MTPEQALSVLGSAASTYHGNLADHTKLQEALRVLNDFIQATGTATALPKEAKSDTKAAASNGKKGKPAVDSQPTK